MWDQAEGRSYARAIRADALVTALMTAFVLRWSGLREIAERMGRKLLGTSNFSSLSHALGRASTLSFARALVQHLESRHEPGKDELVALDSMAVTLPITQRHRCKKYNKTTVGGGVLWGFMIEAARGSCPVRIIHTMAGSWNDASLMQGVKLLARGPVYLMDRGFWSLALLQAWLQDGVRFIVRARYNSVYEVLGELSPPRAYGKKGWIERDARVRLGCHKHKALHPEARMIRAKVGAEHIILVTSEMRWSAERILNAYKKRERIERFHRFLKDSLGLAHLYNFSHTGLMVLLHTALLLALLLFLEAGAPEEQETIAALRAALKALHKALGLGHRWKRNTNTIKRAASAKKYKWQEQQNP